MNNKISNIALSLSAILALSGCGTNSEYEANNNHKNSNQSSSKFGLRGIVLSDEKVANATVCFDTNKNGICDTHEDKTTTNQQGEYSFKKEISDKNKNTTLLAQVKNGGTIKYVLNSKQVSKSEQNITPYTTLLLNEDRYNLRVKKGLITSSTYLNSKLPDLTNEILNGQNYLSNNKLLTNAKNLVNAYKQAYELDSNSPLLGIASVVDELIKNRTYKLNINSISSQNIENNTNNDKDKFKINDLSQTVSWDKSYTYETVLGTASAKNKLVAYSKWNNKLTIIDTKDKSKAPTLSQNERFIYVDGGKDKVDSITGATEEVLSKVEISEDGKILYALIKKQFDNDVDNKGVGIYRANISEGVPKSVLFSRVLVGENYFNSGDITDISLSKDGLKLLASSDDKTIKVFDRNLYDIATQIKTNKRAKSILLSSDKKFAFTGLYESSNNSLGIYNIENRMIVGEYKFEHTPKYLIEGNNNTLFIANSTENKIYHLDINDKSNIKLKNIFKTSYSIKDLSLSKDGKYLIASTNKKQVTIFDSEKPNRKSYIDLQEAVNGAYEISDKKFAVNYGRNVAYYSLTDIKASVEDNIVKIWEQTHRGEK